MAVDLHTHSVVSDGSDTPAEVVRLAASAGLRALALTDHDTLGGLEEAGTAAAGYGIELVPGVELSLDWSGFGPETDEPGGMHLLVLWLEEESGPLQDRLAELRRGRDDRNHSILERLAQLGLDVPMEEVMARAGEGSVGRPHIAGVMVDRGYVPDIASAFEQYLAQGGPAYVGRTRLRPHEAIDLALRSGGVPVLAHPQTLGYPDDARLEEAVRRLAEAGLVGMESHHAAVKAPRRRILRRMADRLGLAPSGGSDYHGTYKPGMEIGIGCGDLSVPDEFLEGLRRRRDGG
ncbi:MAG: PHP domain-containing protein [Actinomycetota bacterium]